MNDWKEKVVLASRMLNLLSVERVNLILLAVADEALLQADQILFENAKDLSKMEIENPLYDRLLLTKERIAAIADDIRKVAALPSPLHKLLSQTKAPNGMRILKQTVPFGVVGVVYESRPNVSFDIFSLCFKSGNACVLKGGSDAFHSNTVIVNLIRSVLIRFGVDENTLTLLPAGREATADLLQARGYVDLIIPRGGRGLIDFVRENSVIPVIETGAGICHVFVDEFADKRKTQDIVFNAKTRRVSVCNALDCLIVHERQLANLPDITRRLAEKDLIIYADEKSYASLSGHYPIHLLQRAEAGSYGTEFLDYKLSVKTVTSIDKALEHISRYSSKHSECIVSENKDNVFLFETVVDAACVYVNVSTAFTDGAQFGLGAEIGISTQKLHARGPMALAELCSYKWIIRGEGQIRD